jgi:plasmid stabilization system protein ParE
VASLEVIFRPGARSDVAKILAFYATEGDRLSVPRFLQAVEEVSARIALFPRSAPKHLGNARRVKLNTFPYWVYYHVLEAAVEVLGILHSKRSPAFVRNRIS